MPVRLGSDKKGRFAQWGYEYTKKYYYKANNVASRERAKAQAAAQGRAIKWAQHVRGGRSGRRLDA
jgi:predicted AAA+ superfamily ATPase